MTQSVRAHQGETLDALIYRARGRTADITEETLKLNPGLSALGPILPEGMQVALPARSSFRQQEKRTIQLWD